MRVKLGIPFKINEIASATKGKVNSNGDKLIFYIVTDSREALADDLFFPLRGQEKNGENYIGEAKSIGAFTISSVTEEADIIVSNTSVALLDFASFYSKKLPHLLYKIGITGSTGKTTVKEFTNIILGERFKVHATLGNFNNEIGLPLSVLCAPRDTQILLIEMGMNHEGEISNLSKCLQPDIGVITNIGRAHIGNLGSRKNIAKAKLEIADGMHGGILFVPSDEDLLSSAPCRATVSTTDKDAYFSLLNSVDESLSMFLSGNQLGDVSFALKEDPNMNCLAFALALCVYLGLSTEELKSGVSLISRENTRQKIVKKGCLYFLADYYNASPESVKACIDTAKQLKNYERKSLLLGDLLELGEESKAIHKELGSYISKADFYNLFLFGHNAEDVAIGALTHGFPAEHIFINIDLSRPDITAEQVKQNSIEGEIIAIKASRGVRIERVLDSFD